MNYAFLSIANSFVGKKVLLTLLTLTLENAQDNFLITAVVVAFISLLISIIEKCIFYHFEFLC